MLGSKNIRRARGVIPKKNTGSFSVPVAPTVSRLTPAARRTYEGFTLIEVIAASAIISIVFLVTIPVVGHVRIVRGESERRMVAQQEAANVMEHVAARASQGELVTRTLDDFRLSSSANVLLDAELNIDVTDDSGLLTGLGVPESRNTESRIAGSRVVVTIGWTTDVGDAAVPVTLTAWFPKTPKEAE